MPHRIDVTTDGNGVIVTLTGDVTGAEVQQANDVVVEETETRRLAFQVWDFTGSERFDITTEQIRSLAMQDARVAKNVNGHKVALVGTDVLFSGIDGIYGVLSEVWGGFDTRRFAGMKEALDWVRGNANPG